VKEVGEGEITIDSRLGLYIAAVCFFNDLL